jgi:PAS domain S-box-containing protein
MKDRDPGPDSATPAADRAAIEKSLRECEQTLGEVQQLARIGTWRYRIREHRIWWSDELYRIFGIARAAGPLSPEVLFSRIHPDDRDTFRAQVESCESCRSDYRIIVPGDGSVKHIHEEVRVERDGQGTPVVLYGTAQDVTDFRLTEEKLQESEERFRAVFENSRDAIGVSLVGLHVFVNPAYLALFGFPPGADLRNRPILDLIAPESRGRVMEYVRERANGESAPSFYEVLGMRTDGSVFNMEVSASACRERGKDHTLVILRDVTERKKAEQEIAERGARLQQILDTANVAIFLLDLTGRITLANKRMTEMFDCGMEDLIGADYLDHIPASEREKRRPHFMAMLTGKISSVDFERRFLRKNGAEFWGHMTGSRLHDAAGRELGLIGVIADITKRKEIEVSLQTTQKLESIGTLAGGIAHDFNNLLQGVFGYISLAKRSIDKKEKALDMLVQAENALHASVNLSSQLLTFSKGGKPVKKVIHLRPVIESAVQFALSGSRVDHVCSIAEDLLPVEADAGQIGQVLQNIVLNADQAMPQGGKIEISARNRAASSVPGFDFTAAGDLVEIAIKDSGTGIAEEHLPRIFDPYFTTKENGTGLGLATSHSIIANHGGAITVRSQQGHGSTFTLYLPAAQKAPCAAPPDARPEPGRRGRILLMDDETVVRLVAGELLRELGHEVAFAEDGESAIAQYREAAASGKSFDVVILDLTVRGGMGGAQAVKQLRALDPEVKAVVSSGYSDDDATAHFQEHGFMAFLKKPYDIDELERVLNALLA